MSYVRFEPPPLETERLILRGPNTEDADEIYRNVCSHPVTRFLLWTPHTYAAETYDFLHRILWPEGPGIPDHHWLIVEKATWCIIGLTSVKFDGHKAAIGAVVGPRYQGHGYGPEAYRKTSEWALSQPQIERVWAWVPVEAVHAQKAVEKAGFQQEGLIRKWIKLPAHDKACDCYFYSITK